MSNKWEVTLLAVAACGGNVGGETGTVRDSGSGGFDGASLLASGLVGSWAVVTGESVIGVFKGDGTYEIDVLGTSSPGSGRFDQEQIERGIYSVSGSTVAFVPKERSCTGPAPTRFDTFTLVEMPGAGPGFVLSDPNTGESSWGANTGQLLASEIAVGCFASGGTFTPTPLAPVSP